MTLMRPNGSDATDSRNRSRDVTPSSGICSRCIDGCRGNCEIFQASFRGRELLYPGAFGEITAGAEKDYPVDYSHLNIQGYALGARGLRAGLKPTPDDATFPNGSTEVEYGRKNKVRMGIPYSSPMASFRVLDRIRQLPYSVLTFFFLRYISNDDRT